MEVGISFHWLTGIVVAKHAADGTITIYGALELYRYHQLLRVAWISNICGAEGYFWHWLFPVRREGSSPSWGTSEIIA